MRFFFICRFLRNREDRGAFPLEGHHKPLARTDMEQDLGRPLARCFLRVKAADSEVGGLIHLPLADRMRRIVARELIRERIVTS